MPVNMDPSKKRVKKPVDPAPETTSRESVSQPAKGENLDRQTERDKEYALADAEWKNLWDATEVIDMDKW